MIRRTLLILGLLLVCAGPGLAQTFVQSGYCGSISSGGTCVYGMNTTATNTNLIFLSLPAAATSITVTDSHNTYTQLSSTNCTGNSLITVFEADNIFGGADTITVSWTGGAATDVIYSEYSGLAASAFDKTSCGHATSTAASSGSTSTTSFANELVVGFGSSCCTTWSAALINGSSTGVNVRTNNVNASYEALWDKNVTSTGAQIAAATNGAVTQYSLFVATFKASSQPATGGSVLH